jgi:hypothetical protein
MSLGWTIAIIAGVVFLVGAYQARRRVVRRDFGPVDGANVTGSYHGIGSHRGIDAASAGVGLDVACDGGGGGNGGGCGGD